MMVRIKQNYKLIPEKSLVGLAVSQYDADTVEFVQFIVKLLTSKISVSGSSANGQSSMSTVISIKSSTWWTISPGDDMLANTAKDNAVKPLGSARIVLELITCDLLPSNERARSGVGG